jgi:hypothetical protein
MSNKMKYLSCGCCIDLTYKFDGNAKGGTYMFGDDDDVLYKKSRSKKRRDRYQPTHAPRCTEAKNHVFVWVKFMQQNYREEQSFIWSRMMNRRIAEPGEFVNRYEFRCIGCGYVKKTAYPNRRWGNPVPTEYEVYETRHLDKYNNIL